jgi:CNT family concentrative nucleoside transporter
MSDAGLRWLSVFGFFVMIGLAWLASSNRRQVPWRTVGWGIGIQIVLALVLLKSDAGRFFFAGVSAVVSKLLEYTEAGSRFVFGALLDTGFSFALSVLPTIVFMGSLFAILYHLGVVQIVVRAMAALLSRTMRSSGAESLAAVANVFVGMVESCLVIKPYIAGLTRSELFCTMTLGMATVAGSVLLAYVQILGGADYAGHLVTASLLSAPAGLLIAKIMIPETGTPVTRAGGLPVFERDTVNIFDAAAEGAINALRLAAYVGAMLLAFIALIAVVNDVLGALGGAIGAPGLSLQQILGFVLAPLAFVMGVPWADASEVGALLGVKTVLNEFIAYQQLAELMANDAIGRRSQVIASYALCGFANFGSLAILLGGIGGMAPERRHEVAQLGLRAILAGSLTTFMTACVAGALL